MNFIEYVKENTEGLVFIDILRKVIKNFCSEGIKEEFMDVTDEDIEKMYLMLECNFFTGIISEDSEWDLNTIKVDEVQFLINSNIGLFSLMREIEKNRRESYSEILFDVLFQAIDKYDYVDLLRISDIVSLTLEKISNTEAGEDGYTYDMILNDDVEKCLSDIYQWMIKDIVNN